MVVEEGNATVQESKRRLRIVPAAVIAGLLVVAGCSAGQNTQTDSVEPAVNGTLGQVGPILVRDAQFAYPAEGGVFPSGGTAPLVLSIVNTGSADDELVEVTSPVAGDVQVSGDRMLTARGAIQVGNADKPATPPSSQVTTARPSSSSAAPSSGRSAPSSSVGASTAPVEIGRATIVLTGLNAPLYAGKTYQVTFVFRRAGTLTLELPIATPTTARARSTSERSAG